MTAGAQALLIAAIAWGAFAFGAVYPWAFWPLVVALLVAAIGGLACCRGAASLSDHRWLAAALIVCVAAMLLQLVPLPLAVLAKLSPHTLEALDQLDVRVAIGAASRHAISIAPSRTLTGAIFFATFGLLVFGSSRLMSLRGPRGLAEALTVIGVLLAITAIVQRPFSNGKVYGFWTPQMGGNPFGPFVNRNHFAGWMVMELPVTIGLLCGSVARSMRHVKPTFRDRVLWLSSPQASRLVLVAGAAATMALSLVLTMSRSGIAATTMAIAVTGVIASRRQQTLVRRTIVVAYLVLLVVMVTAWVGVDALANRFANADGSALADRRAVWADAAAIASRFPLTGTGLNTYGVATLIYQQYDRGAHYAEAHNDYLQLLAEGGALLAVPAVICVGAFVALVRRRFTEEAIGMSYWIRVGAATGIVAIALQETVEFSLQMPGNAALFSVLCAMAIHKGPAHDRPAQEEGRMRNPA